jgi:hypothetical protein
MAGSMTRSHLTALAVVAGLGLCALSGLGGADLLVLAPALVLMGTLLARRYPGERLLLAVAARRRRRPARARMARPSLSKRARCVPRGGLLMGFALAVRPPPLSLLAS